MSFLEMIDVLNERLIAEGKDPIAFDHDCREGICGACSMYIDGRPHGPWQANTTCQLHMRAYKDGDTIMVEPWSAQCFPGYQRPDGRPYTLSTASSRPVVISL